MKYHLLLQTNLTFIDIFTVYSEKGSYINDKEFKGKRKERKVARSRILISQSCKGDWSFKASCKENRANHQRQRSIWCRCIRLVSTNKHQKILGFFTNSTGFKIDKRTCKRHIVAHIKCVWTRVSTTNKIEDNKQQFTNLYCINNY